MDVRLLRSFFVLTVSALAAACGADVPADSGPSPELTLDTTPIDVDPPTDPSTELAAAHLERHRDDRHRERVHVRWSTEPVATAPDGMAVLLVRGYATHELTLFRVEGQDVRGLRVTTAVVDEDAGEQSSPLSCVEFAVDRAAFSRVWEAAARLRDARAEPREPQPGMIRLGGSFGSGSHEPHRAVSICPPGGAEPLHFHVRGESEDAGIRDFDELRADALYDLFHSLVPATTDERAPLAAWRPFLHEFVCAHAVDLDVQEREPARVLLTTTLGLLGVAGDRGSAECVQMLRGTLAATRGNTFGVAAIQSAASLCLVKLDLRTRWDPLRAAEMLRSHDDRSDVLLHAWIRRTWQTRDAVGYLEQVRSDLAWAATTEDVTFTRECLAALASGGSGLDPTTLADGTLQALLEHSNPDVRVETALAILDHDAAHAPSRSALSELARARELDPPYWQAFDATARCRAVERLAELERWMPDRFRTLFARTGEDARFVRWLAAQLEERGAAVPEATLAATYRKCLDGGLRPGLLAAVQELVLLGDTAALDRMDVRLDDLEEAWEIGENDPIGRWNAQRTIPKLRTQIAERRAATEKR